jgi:hypothetical protein
VAALAFVSWFGLATAGQSQQVGQVYRDGYWAASFPPLARPWALPGWFLGVHAGEAFGYPIGGDHGASAATFLLMLAGGRWLWRTGRRTQLAILLGPVLATLLAAVLGKYPYGGAARTMQHVAPTVCLLAGAGAFALLSRFADPARRRRLSAAFAAGLALIGLAHAATDLVAPYRTREDLASRDFARWFWPEMARDARVLCARTAAGQEFAGAYWKLGRWELYLAHRDLLAPPAPASPLAPGRLRCVFFNDSPDENPALAAWLDTFALTHEPAGVRWFVVNPGVVDRGMPREERYLVYEFTPRRPHAAPSAARSAATGRARREAAR